MIVGDKVQTGIGEGWLMAISANTDLCIRLDDGIIILVPCNAATTLYRDDRDNNVTVVHDIANLTSSVEVGGITLLGLIGVQEQLLSANEMRETVLRFSGSPTVRHD